MGNSIGFGRSSIRPQAAEEEDDNICLDCDKKNQKELPVSDLVSASGQPCGELYTAVNDCMVKYDGQITSCTTEWDRFRECHQLQKQHHSRRS